MPCVCNKKGTEPCGFCEMEALLKGNDTRELKTTMSVANTTMEEQEMLVKAFEQMKEADTTIAEQRLLLEAFEQMNEADNEPSFGTTMAEQRMLVEAFEMEKAIKTANSKPVTANKKTRSNNGKTHQQMTQAANEARREAYLARRLNA